MFRTKNQDQINAALKNTLMEHLSIKVSEIGDNFICAEMPVGPTVHQPMGYLHGGATLALAESIGSMASFLLIDPEKFSVFGLEVNANHIRSKKEGIVTAKATPIHIGSTTHVWDIKIVDEKEKLISIVRMTNIVVNAKK